MGGEGLSVIIYMEIPPISCVQFFKIFKSKSTWSDGMGSVYWIRNNDFILFDLDIDIHRLFRGDYIMLGDIFNK